MYEIILIRGQYRGKLMTSKISSREEEILIGTILGDAHLARLKSGARLEMMHSEKQKEYLVWKYEELKRFTKCDLCFVTIRDSRNGHVYREWKYSGCVHEAITCLHNLFYKNKKNKRKIVPENINSILTSPLSLAVWFMDDGGRRNDSYGHFLNTLAFTDDEHELLLDCLRTNFDLECRLHWIQDGYRIFIPRKETERFCSIVHPHIVPSMQYKLSFNPVTTSYARLDRARDRGKTYIRSPYNTLASRSRNIEMKV